MGQPLKDWCMGCMEPRQGSVCANCGFVEGTPPDSPVFLPPRTVLDERYLLGRVLGAGGFGITYLAWDLNLDLKLAVKEYFPNAFGARDRNERTVVPANTESREAFDRGLAKFLNEGRALARFQGHPNIASVMTFFKENGTSYLVMKFEDGITLQEYLRMHDGRMDFETAMQIAMPVMDALRAVHEEGILHRDISPDNIIINRSLQIKIIDFGSAKRDMTSRDKTLQITLKRGFSPEEQYRANGPQGPWTDVYAVAATLYQCLTGTKPPDALDRLDRDTIQPPSALGVTIPKTCEKALMKALAVRAADRIRTIEEFQKALLFRPPDPPWQRLPQWIGNISAGVRDWLRARTRPAALTGGAALVLFALAFFIPALFAVPQIRQFTASPSVVQPGQAVELRWSVAGGKVRISPGPFQISRDSGFRKVFPSANTTYTLTVTGPVRSVSRSAMVRVAAQPLAVTLTAEPPTIRPGASIELAWSVAGDPARVTIDQGIGVVGSAGRLKVSPTSNTTYTLRAEGRDGVASEASVTVLIEVPLVPRPAIVSLAAGPAKIRKGQKAQLTWQVTGDNTLVNFDQNIGRVRLQDTLSVSPQQTTTYKLLARNPGGTVSKLVTVEVAQPEPPKIDAFGAAPESIPFGQSATLSWTVTGEVESVSIPGIGTVAAEGSRSVMPKATTTYSISATGPGGTSKLDTTVRVAAPRAPKIPIFTATPQVVAPGQAVNLRWRVEGDAESITLDPGAVPLPKEGSKLVAPTTTTSYRLTATGPSGTQSVTADVQVSAEPFDIVSFEAMPARIRRGQPATILWKVTGPVNELSVEPDVGNLQGRNSGSVQVRPDSDTSYTISAQAGNRVLTKTIRIAVRK